MAEVKVIESTKSFDIVKIEGIKAPENIQVVSGVIKEVTSDSLTLWLGDNDAISIEGEVSLWWNREKKCFVRQ